MVKAPRRVLLLGAEGSGKTSLSRRLRESCAGGSAGAVAGGVVREAEPVATVGVELHTLRPHPPASAHVELREVGGAMRAVWPQYYGAADGVCFVVDGASAAGAAAGARALWALCADERASHLPLLLVLSKRDLPCAMPQAQLEGVLRLHDVRAALGARLQVLSSASTVAVGRAATCAAEVVKWAAALHTAAVGDAATGVRGGGAKVAPVRTERYK